MLLKGAESNSSHIFKNRKMSRSHDDKNKIANPPNRYEEKIVLQIKT